MERPRVLKNLTSLIILAPSVEKMEMEMGLNLNISVNAKNSILILLQRPIYDTLIEPVSSKLNTRSRVDGSIPLTF
jgi:hypothetical protein